jgi:hypothetical protein
MSDKLKTISTGNYALSVDCPECGREAVLPISLDVELRVSSEGGTIRATMSTKRAEHNCSGEQEPAMFEGSGQAPFDSAVSG